MHEMPEFITHGQVPSSSAPNRTRRKRAEADAQLLNFVQGSPAQPAFSLEQHIGVSFSSKCEGQLPPLRFRRDGGRQGVAQPRQPGRAITSLAALSLSWFDVFNRGGGLRTAISQSWAQIDVDQSGSLSLAELEDYARQNGLPREYVQTFMSAVLQASQTAATTVHSSPSPPEQEQQDNNLCLAAPASTCSAWPLQQPMLPGGQQPQAPLVAALSRWLHKATNSSSDTAQEAPQLELTFGMFEKFVRSRETALRRAFDLFDRNRDGVISAEDLEASLTHIAICCPRSRCVYRCPRTMAHAMLQRTQAVGQSDGSSVDFASFRRFFMLLPQTELAVEYWLRAGTLPLLTEKLAAVHEGGEPGPKAAAWGHLFAGAVAGAASRTATAPLETLRLAVMTGALPAGNLVQAASSIVEAQGWRGLYRGNALNVLRSAPQKALDFFAFDAFKRLLAGERGPQDEGTGAAALRTFAAAGLAGATSWALLYPLETVRSRITAGVAPAGASVMHVARSILRLEGVGALYRGLGWSLAGIFPEAALCYGLHDLLKHCYRRSHQGAEPGVLPSLGFGVLSAFTGQLVAFPLETIARRLQVYQGPGGLPTMLNGMLQQGGPMVLYRGVGAATLRLVPMAIVSFGTYEGVRTALLALEDGAGAVQADTAYAQVHSYCTPLKATLSRLSGTSPQPSPSPAELPCALRNCSLLPASGISTHHCSSLDSRLTLGNRRTPVGAAVMCGAQPSGSTSVGPIATEAVLGDGDSVCVDTLACPGGASLMCAAKQAGIKGSASTVACQSGQSSTMAESKVAVSTATLPSAPAKCVTIDVTAGIVMCAGAASAAKPSAAQTPLAAACCAVPATGGAGCQSVECAPAGAACFASTGRT